ncbi:hypothetical protein [Deinococcus ficus]|uniref:hypothetical protein n=1 Tax=Deinococcus ficus TaxID=317577 RepID=UPI0003B74936|nr:hypothetical protein [Deinococcus ficus]
MNLHLLHFTGLDRHAALLRAADAARLARATRPQPERLTGSPWRRAPAAPAPTPCPTC